MTTLNNAEAVRNITRVSQILVAAMAMGLLVFLVIVLVIDTDGPAPAAAVDRDNPLGLPMLTLIAAIFGASGVVLSFFVPGLVVGGGLKRLAERGPENLAMEDARLEGTTLPATDAGALLQLFQAQLIIASALVEGAAFLALIAYMLERHPLALGIAALLIVVLLSRFPTLDRVHAWLDDQSARLANLRRGGF